MATYCPDRNSSLSSKHEKKLASPLGSLEESAESSVAAAAVAVVMAAAVAVAVMAAVAVAAAADDDDLLEQKEVHPHNVNAEES